MLVSDFDYDLPQNLIAQHPITHRGDSRMLVYKRTLNSASHHQFHEIVNFLKKDDLLVLNDSKVFPARLRGRRPNLGKVEALLLDQADKNVWWAMIKPGKRLGEGESFDLIDRKGEPVGCKVRVADKNDDGHGLLQFSLDGDIWDRLAEWGEIPLPPYIARPEGCGSAEDMERYQTTYAAHPGSVAAPTAGLHFTSAILSQLEANGINIGRVTLHVGAGTFQPVKTEHTRDHRMHEERYFLPPRTLEQVQTARAAGGRVIAVGTTSLRVLESAHAGGFNETVGRWCKTRLFVEPPRAFGVVDGLLTNFHLPRSTLLMLVSAFLAPESTEGREKCLELYREAIAKEYRFFSYGDAMLIL